MSKRVKRAVIVLAGLGLAITGLLASGAMTIDHGNGTLGVSIGSGTAYAYVVAWGPHGPDLGFEQAG